VTLYPLDTVKNRIMANPKHDQSTSATSFSTSTSVSSVDKQFQFFKLLYVSFIRAVRQGNLYRGIVPSLLIAAPAAGVYFGVRDVVKRVLSQMIFPMLHLEEDPIGVIGIIAALIADVVSLAARTPGDVLALRLQVAGQNENEYQNGNDTNGSGSGNTKPPPVPPSYEQAFKDAFERLPAVIVTDLPYLLSRVGLSYYAMAREGGPGPGAPLGQYELTYVLIACTCAALTTPFEVAQTRILVPEAAAKDDTDKHTTVTVIEERQETERSSLPYFMISKANSTSITEPPPPPQQDEEHVMTHNHKKRRRSSRRNSVWYTMHRVMREDGGGIKNLYAGWIERTAYFGLGKAWLDPLRVIGYLGIRDAVLLAFLDHADKL
jgi:hypothetical protein